MTEGWDEFLSQHADEVAELEEVSEFEEHGVVQLELAVRTTAARSLVEAWEHVQDHPCPWGITVITEFFEFVVERLATALDGGEANEDG